MKVTPENADQPNRGACPHCGRPLHHPYQASEKTDAVERSVSRGLKRLGLAAALYLSICFALGCFSYQQQLALAKSEIGQSVNLSRPNFFFVTASAVAAGVIQLLAAFILLGTICYLIGLAIRADRWVWLEALGAFFFWGSMVSAAIVAVMAIAFGVSIV